MVRAPELSSVGILVLLQNGLHLSNITETIDFLILTIFTMKKFFIFSITAMILMACSSKTAEQSEVEVVVPVDSTVVDSTSIDSMVIDSIIVDSIK